MTNIGLKEWLNLLSEAGVTFTSNSYKYKMAQSAAERLDLKLKAADLDALRELEVHFSPTQIGNVGILLNLLAHHQPGLASAARQNIPARRCPPDHNPMEPVPIPKMSVIPPWGHPEDDVALMQCLSQIPIDWSPEDGEEPAPSNWNLWRNNLAVEIASKLWPLYGKGGWSEGPPVGPLLDADFQLLFDLRDYHGLPIRGKYPTQVLHCNLFVEEDDDNIYFGTGYERYDPTLPGRILKDLPTMFAAGMANKVGTLDLQLKFLFQRPRAHQVALIQGRDRYNYTWARSSNTPSLVSGHCLEASIAGCTAFVALQTEKWDGKDQSIDVLKQFTVDIGDRRVFAGVHYPSDNLASWYVAFNLLPRVFRKPVDAHAAKTFLWDAIGAKSVVFGAIKAHSDANVNSPYRKMVEQLHRLGNGG